MQNPELTRALTDSAIPAPKFKSALGTYVRLIRQSRDDSSIEARQAAATVLIDEAAVGAKTDRPYWPNQSLPENL
jgi:hypothetical protein